MREHLDVICLGELVVDMISAGSETPHLFRAEPGGAPGNVAVGLARLGRRVGMVAKVGDDVFGRMLQRTLVNAGVDVSGIILSRAAQTGLAVVTNDAAGEREFTFYRHAAADLQLAACEIDFELVRRASVLHVGSIAVGGRTSAAAQREAVRVAKKSGVQVSADPNLRLALWPDEAAMLAAAREVLADASIVKVGADELLLLSDRKSIEDAVRSIWHQDLRLVAVTDGSRGATLFTRTNNLHHGGYAVDAVDTTGAGDAFAASMLAELAAQQFAWEDRAVLANVLARATAAGALATTRRGGMTSLPDRAAIDELMCR